MTNKRKLFRYYRKILRVKLSKDCSCSGCFFYQPIGCTFPRQLKINCTDIKQKINLIFNEF